MKKKIFILSLMCAFSFSATVCAAPGEMHIDHPQEGVTEGWVEEECVIVDGNVVSVNNLVSSREMFLEYVGIGAEDAGPWEHGVTGSGLLYSYYTNKKNWHGSSVRGTAGLTRSLTVPANQKSIAQAQTLSIDNNHAYWRVDENMK